MCGIAGYVDFSSKTNPLVVKKMTDKIIYRGPDSSGKYISKNKVVGLGIRRLSIIDLKTGDQPIKNEDGNVVVVYNGEIYNYSVLKIELEKKGHKFKTKSDTEVLVHGYEEWGIAELIKKLNGMFAFAIWDEKNQKLYLGRDRVGIKPLYYSLISDKLIFGSEPKTILAFPGFRKSVSAEGLNSFFYLGFTFGDKSIFSKISKLSPGHFLIFDKAGIKIREYFELNEKDENPDISLDELLKQSVRKQLVADVPVGVFLSGGLDSSLVSYYISGFKNLKSFSIGFSEEGFDESKHAHYVAKLIGTEHYSEEYSTDDVLSTFDEITSKLDEPFADASLFPTYKVSKLARRYVKVVLSGDGGDELFGGYPTYQAHILAKYFNKIPFLSADLLSSLLEKIPETFLDLIPLSFKDYPKKKLAMIVLRGLKIKNSVERHHYWMRSFFLGENTFAFKTASMHGLYSDKLSGSLKGKVNIGQKIDFYSYLPDDFLVKVDRASMYNSLEARVPYLDNDVIDYAFSTNYPHVNLLGTKLQMRKLIEEKLPEIAKRPKKGFGIPLEKWLRGRLKTFAFQMITNKKLYDYVEKKYVLKIWENHQNLMENNSGALWQLIIFSGWLNNYL